MPSAEIIAIGTELLLGETLDTNTRFIARALRVLGIDLFRATIIGDNENRIAASIREALMRADIVITSGGLGPTVDDPTRTAVAAALDRQVEFKEELWQQILQRFSRFNRKATENNRRQAYIPEGGLAIENPVGTAPAFLVEQNNRVVISLPGVPREMEYLVENAVLPFLKTRFGLQGTILTRTLHLAGVGESQVDEWIGDLEKSANPTVGLSAHAGQIDIRISAKAGSPEEAEAMVADFEQTLQDRLGEHIYGKDDETLEGVLGQKLTQRGWTLAVLDSGMDGRLAARMSPLGLPFENQRRINQSFSEEQQFVQAAEILLSDTRAQVILAANMVPAGDRTELTVLLITPTENQKLVRSYGGPPQMAAAWSVNTAMDFLRRNI